MRLDALGEHLTVVANLEEGEFDFGQPPALGGPEGEMLGDPYTAPDFINVIDQLSQQIENREQQLAMLDQLMVKRKLQDDVFIAGRPITKGWMSSRFGRRDRKSTRLKSSHVANSYAVFCMKHNSY